MKLNAGVMLVCMMMAETAAAETFALPVDFWLTPRSGASVRNALPLQQAVAAYLKSDKARVRITHQKRDESIAQAEELRGWLIALGVDAARIELSEDNPSDVIKLEIMESR